MKNKSRRSVRFIAGVLAAALFVLCFTTACQPTPEKPVVVGKGDGRLEEIIASSDAESQTYQAPTHWTDSAEIADLSVVIDAYVTVPDVEKFPVGVVAPDSITQAQADKLMEVFLQGATLYEQGQDSDEAVTKDEIMDSLIRIQQDISDPKSDFNTKTEKGTSEYEEGLALRQQEIAALQKAYETAPDMVPMPKPASTTFKRNMESNALAPRHIPNDATEEERKTLEAENKDLQDNPEKYVPYEIQGVATLPDGQRAALYITQSTGYWGPARVNFGVGGQVIPESWLMSMGQYGGVPYGDVPVVPSNVAREDAAELALETLNKLGLEHLGIAATETGYIIEQNPETYETLSQRECHIFILMRTLNGVTANHAHFIEPQDMQYMDTLSSEGAQIVVGDQGVISFSWLQPMKLLSIENESVSVKPFSEIQKIFKKQITFNGAWNSSSGLDQNVISRRIVIEEARLGLMRTVRRDRPSEYLLLPVWDFYGYEANKCAEQEYQGPKLDDNNEYTVRDFGRSYLTINAIDGSVIDRGMGY